MLHEPVLDWYDAHRRDLPWRRPGATAWSVMVSEFMLQQTPVARVLPVHAAWLDEWPTPADLANAPVGEAVRAWGRLGYPRRALRLHAAATVIRDDHDGAVPAELDALRSLPGVGDYTAAAIASFAFAQRHVVLDTNVRRVLSRVCSGQAHPPTSVRTSERRLAESLLPDDPAVAARWAVAVMELGALVCVATSPRCASCPVATSCAWRAAGKPAHDGPPRRAQAWGGTDRQCRGRLMAVLRASDGPVPRADLEGAWADAAQRERCLDALVSDGLVEPLSGAAFALPGTTAHP
uniref:Adenine DNA glycosylase n=1 Tax=uncultured Nocardioidaceae bacterium TaxID=253824 RepID=A0A6J4LVM1_9ACTN|nr:MAG: A/G-specific adenine glycosylase [uncultured Nocardioidaceae bacterium]